MADGLTPQQRRPRASDPPSTVKRRPRTPPPAPPAPRRQQERYLTSPGPRGRTVIILVLAVASTTSWFFWPHPAGQVEPKIPHGNLSRSDDGSGLPRARVRLQPEDPELEDPEDQDQCPCNLMSGTKRRLLAAGKRALESAHIQDAVKISLSWIGGISVTLCHPGDQLDELDAPTAPGPAAGLYTDHGVRGYRPWLRRSFIVLY